MYCMDCSRMDRNMAAIALTGDSFAGKGYFSYQLAKLFHRWATGYKAGIGVIDDYKLKGILSIGA